MNKAITWVLIFIFLFTGCATPAQQEPTGVESTTATTTTTPYRSPTLTTAIMTLAPTNTPFMTSVSPTESVVIAKPVAIQDVIDFEMRGSFDFFWEQANTDPNSPGYGLIRDRYPGNPTIASMASVGFGLTAYIIGVEKGYITYDEAYERTNRTLDTLLKMDRTEGWYFHFVDINTGKRAWKSEVSNIDTSLLLLGVLSSGEYFGGEIAEKANRIYDTVNWQWFLDKDTNHFYMGYKPKEGHFGHWDFYAEQLMMYVLAAGSDTYPIDQLPYYAFIRERATWAEGEPFIHSWFHSIFTYQFSHAWIDFRGLTDKKGDNWFENSVEASKAHVTYATMVDHKYETIGPDAWGLTASDGPDGYNGSYGAPPSANNNSTHFIDDTVAPCGAIGSIIFVPEDSKRAMLHYYSFDELKGEYGFQDAYNLSRDWFAPDVIGIDKGISLLMLANYENNLVYDVMMKNENIQKGLRVLELSEGE